MKIGADELILWLRKNSLANNIPNDGINGLGQKIHDLVILNCGKQIHENFPSYWEDADKNVGQFNLPKTSAQYEIDFSNIGALYKGLFEMYQ